MRGAWLPLLLLVPPTGAAAAPPRPVLGDYIDVGDRSLLPQILFQFDVPKGPRLGVYREIALNWHDEEAPEHYPDQAFAARREGKVRLRLTVEADGRISACRVTGSSGKRDLDAHACSFMTAERRFHPGLDDQGRRFGGTLDGTLSYQLRSTIVTLAGSQPGAPRGGTPPRPLEPVTMASLGIAPGAPPPRKVFAIGAQVEVDPEGKPGACRLFDPTFDDSIDKTACDRLRRDIRFAPAADAAGRPVAGLYSVRLLWPD